MCVIFGGSARPFAISKPHVTQGAFGRDVGPFRSFQLNAETQGKLKVCETMRKLNCLFVPGDLGVFPLVQSIRTPAVSRSPGGGFRGIPPRESLANVSGGTSICPAKERLAQ